MIDAWELPGQPDWLVYAQGDLWLKRDDGVVSAFDPDRGMLVEDISSGYSGLPACQGLAYDGKRLWTCAGENKVVALDPDRGRIARTIRVARLSDQTRFVASHGQLWLIGADGQSLVGLSLADGAVQTKLDLGAFCTDLARDDVGTGDEVFAVCPTDGLVLRLNVATADVTGELPLENPRVAAVGDGALWVTFDGGLAQIDRSELSVKAVYPLNTGIDCDLVVGQDAVWVRMSGRQMLAKVDPAGQRVEELITASKYNTIGDLILLGDDLWTTASDDGVLLRLSTGAR
jgi:outer membrane protein assembly factor BamB